MLPLVLEYKASGMNVSATARALGMPRQTVQDRIKMAVRRELLGDEYLKDPNAPSRSEYLSAKTRKIERYQKKKAKGDWRKPVMAGALPLKPFRLKVFGDPHLDADGCNFDLFERHWLDLGVEKSTYGICVGDFFNNWLRVLAHLWKHEGDPDDAWLLLEGLMAERGEALIGACSGNHDDWTHGPADPVDLLMKKYGVRYRKGAIRLLFTFTDAPEASFTIALRHKWRGGAIYSAAHGIRRAGEKGWRDLIAIGGHIHQDEPRLYTCPETGEHSHVCQISSFKEFDDHVDVQGFQGPRISPVWDLVIDPRRAATDPDKVKVFWDEGAAAAYLEAIQ
ncbi:hypothetical protein [Halovulum sp. GXIMD14793]